MTANRFRNARLCLLTVPLAFACTRARTSRTDPAPTPARADAACTATSSLNLLSRGGRVVPEIRDGRMVALRLYSLRPGGALARAGLRNGDSIVAIGGRPVAQAFDGCLDGAVLDVVRDGRPLRLSYPPARPPAPP